MRQLMFGKDDAAMFDDSLGTNHLAVCCDVGQLTLKLGFELVTPSGKTHITSRRSRYITQNLHYLIGLYSFSWIQRASLNNLQYLHTKQFLPKLFFVRYGPISQHENWRIMAYFQIFKCCYS